MSPSRWGGTGTNREVPPPSHASSLGTGCSTSPVSFRSSHAFTLVEVLAALLMMAIVVPVAMEGMSVASRVGILGQRKAAAMRVAERLLNELVIENQLQQSSSGGTITDGDTSYPWTMRTETWSEDAMLQMTVTVNFVLRGNTYDVSLSTLLPSTTTGTELAATQE